MTQTTAAAEPMTTVNGFAVQVMGFIPVPKSNLSEQIRISTLLLDVQEGRKSPAELIPLLREPDFRANNLNRRFPVADVNKWTAAAPAENKQDDRQLDIETVAAKQKAKGNIPTIKAAS
jgi:hypothetical protein